jgi:hypothetical protein
MRGQSICTRSEVAAQEGLEVTTEKQVAGQVGIAVEGVDEESLSVLVQEAVASYVVVAASSPSELAVMLSSTSSTTQMLTTSPPLASQNGSNAFELDARLAGDTRRLQNSTEAECLNHTTVVPFSIRLPSNTEVMSSARLLQLVQSRLADRTQRPICVAWKQEPVETEELVIKTKSGEVILDLERYDIVVDPAAEDEDDEDGKISEIAIAVALIATIVLICLCCVVAFILRHLRYQNENAELESETTPDFAVTLSKCENGYLNQAQEVHPEADAKVMEASTLGSSGADFGDNVSSGSSGNDSLAGIGSWGNGPWGIDFDDSSELVTIFL